MLVWCLFVVKCLVFDARCLFYNTMFTCLFEFKGVLYIVWVIWFVVSCLSIVVWRVCVDVSVISICCAMRVLFCCVLFCVCCLSSAVLRLC